MRLRAGEVAKIDDTVRDIDARLSEVERERRERAQRRAGRPGVRLLPGLPEPLPGRGPLLLAVRHAGRAASRRRRRPADGRHLLAGPRVSESRPTGWEGADRWFASGSGGEGEASPGEDAPPPPPPPACAVCGAELEPDQTYCLECGSPTPLAPRLRRSGRTAALLAGGMIVLGLGAGALAFAVVNDDEDEAGAATVTTSSTVPTGTLPATPLPTGPTTGSASGRHLVHDAHRPRAHDADDARAHDGHPALDDRLRHGHRSDERSHHGAGHHLRPHHRTDPRDDRRRPTDRRTGRSASPHGPRSWPRPAARATPGRPRAGWRPGAIPRACSSPRTSRTCARVTGSCSRADTALVTAPSLRRSSSARSSRRPTPAASRDESMTSSRVVLITGASSGIGEATARALSQRGPPRRAGGPIPRPPGGPGRRARRPGPRPAGGVRRDRVGAAAGPGRTSGRGLRGRGRRLRQRGLRRETRVPRRIAGALARDGPHQRLRRRAHRAGVPRPASRAAGAPAADGLGRGTQGRRPARSTRRPSGRSRRCRRPRARSSTARACG